jgi:outer membrane protein assembly factor BamB
MTGRLMLVLLVAGVLTATAALAADWPHFAGPTSNHLAPDTGLNKDWAQKAPPVLWKVALSDEGYAGPSVAEGKVFIIDHQGGEDVVRALDLEKGQDVWSFRYADPGGSNYGFARATPTFDDGLLYVLGRRGQLLALNAADGKEVWSRNLVKDFGGKPPQWNYAASPAVDGDRLIVLPGGNNSMVAVLNKKTGETIWSGGGTGDVGYATPVIATINDVKQYLVHTTTALTGVAAEDGKLLWQIPWKTEYGVNACMPLVEGNYVFLTSGYDMGCGVYEITANGPQQVWLKKGTAAISSQFNSPIYYQGSVYSISDPGKLVCLAPRDGSVAWQQEGFEKGGLVIVDGVIIALNGANGDLIVCSASPDGYKELGRLPTLLGGQSWVAPIVSDGRLIIRNTGAGSDDHPTVLACLDLR